MIHTEEWFEKSTVDSVVLATFGLDEKTAARGDLRADKRMYGLVGVDGGISLRGASHQPFVGQQKTFQ
jgi:hypothetical protein